MIEDLVSWHTEAPEAPTPAGETYAMLMSKFMIWIRANGTLSGDPDPLLMLSTKRLADGGQGQYDVYRGEDQRKADEDDLEGWVARGGGALNEDFDAFIAAEYPHLHRAARLGRAAAPLATPPIPALAAVNAQQPTAELRPPDAKQTDEGDLMPYPLLDAIEDAAIGDNRSPLETFQCLRAEHPDIPARQLAQWVERFYRLWCRNQWKRERYAPSFHVDDKNLDPKTWCRFPILSGGFERELAELWTHVEALPPG